MASSLRSLAALALFALVAGLPAAARADLAKCQAAIQKAAAAFEKAEIKALARCESLIRAGKLVDQDCRNEPKTLAVLAKADAKRTKTIGKACGGADKVCGGDLTGEFGGAALGYGATCPDLTGADCDNEIAADSCGGVDECLACIGRESVDLGDDFGWALGVLLRGYRDRVKHAVGDFPHGTRGYDRQALLEQKSHDRRTARTEGASQRHLLPALEPPRDQE